MDEASEQLRHALEEALLVVGQSFLAHPGNAALRAALASGKLSARDYFHELISLLYSLLAMKIIAARGLEHGVRPDAWAPKQLRPNLTGAKLEKQALAWLRDEAALRHVSGLGLGPAALSSVYESLLELVPQVRNDGHEFGWASAKGHARKMSGSYYTPDDLANALLDSALEPVLETAIARSPEQPVEALLSLSIIDPACGGGNLLCAAARRVAIRIARMQAQRAPTGDDYRRALRQVLSRCIYGVDLDPMAVELCKFSLWYETTRADHPPGDVDLHIFHGNALLGTTPELLAKGIPDVAWEPIKGDDKHVARALAQRNKRAGAVDLRALDGCDQRFLADAWCAAFVWPKRPGALADAAPTNELWSRVRAGEPVPALTRATVEKLVDRHRFFHWHLQFPELFARGGFDVVLGNPPWEKVKLQEKEWFAAREPTIAAAASAAQRKAMIRGLARTNPVLRREYVQALRRAEGEAIFLRKSGRYPLCGRGDINLYAAFVELMRGIQHNRGRVGCIVPTGVATDDTTKLFFQELVDTRSLVSLFDFENGKGLFPGVQANVKFCLLTLSSTGPERFRVAAQLDDPGRLRDAGRVYELSAADIRAVNPNTRNCPMFRRERDARLVTAIHRRHGVLIRERADAAELDNDNPWNVSFLRTFHMTNDSGLFKTWDDLEGGSLGDDHVPLHEAKLVHQFHHRAATFEGVARADRFKIHAAARAPDPADLADPRWRPQPRYWVPAAEVERRWGSVNGSAAIGFRNAISATADSRSLVATIVPRIGAGNSLPLLHSKHGARGLAVLAAMLNSFVVDYVLRQKASGGNLNFYVLKQLPILAPALFERRCAWADSSLADWIVGHVLELTYTAWDLEPFARELGHEGAPFRWDPERRFSLRCELDAALFHLYGLSCEDAEHVLDSFPIVHKNDQKAHGEHRTKQVILDRYDAMAEAGLCGE